MVGKISEDGEARTSDWSASICRGHRCRVDDRRIPLMNATPCYTRSKRGFALPTNNEVVTGVEAETEAAADIEPTTGLSCSVCVSPAGSITHVRTSP